MKAMRILHFEFLVLRFVFNDFGYFLVIEIQEKKDLNLLTLAKIKWNNTG
jgi:hypothetical protein